MNRRRFVGIMVGGIAVAASIRMWPFRVYSFPSGIKVMRWYDYPENFDIAKLSEIPYNAETLAIWNQIKHVPITFSSGLLTPNELENVLKVWGG